MNIGETARALPERQHLNFPHAVNSACEFLRNLGFNVVQSGPTIVVFEKDNLRVTLYHGRHSWEIGLEVSKDDETYSLFLILSVAEMPSAHEYRNPVATNGPAVISGVSKVSGLLRQYGQAALLGDPSFFDQLQRRRQDWSQRMHVNQMRAKAYAAFRERRYRDAADLYADIEKALTPAEQKKLVFARRKATER